MRKTFQPQQVLMSHDRCKNTCSLFREHTDSYNWVIDANYNPFTTLSEEHILHFPCIKKYLEFLHNNYDFLDSDLKKPGWEISGLGNVHKL
jgi:hypothetical protein